MRTRFLQSGYTLLELSVVLLVLALIAGFGISLGQNIMQGSDRITTQQRLVSIQTALNSYAQQYGYLPCPSSRALLPTDSAFGVEQRIATPGAYPAARCDTTTSPALKIVPSAVAPSIYIGAVPTQTLGLPANYAADAWGNKFLYAVSYQHVSGSDSYFTQDGPITVNFSDGVNSYPITTNRLGVTGAGAVYAVVSHGADGKGGYAFNSTTQTIACTAGAIDSGNCDDGDAIFYDAAFNDGDSTSASFFDDYIIWGSNKLNRAPVLSPTSGYTSAGYGGLSGTTCPAGVCEAWCAPCFNQPIYTPDPAAANPMQIYVCSSTITSAAPNCEAKCIYGYMGDAINNPGIKQPCQ